MFAIISELDSMLGNNVLSLEVFDSLKKSYIIIKDSSGSNKIPTRKP